MCVEHDIHGFDEFSQEKEFDKKNNRPQRQNAKFGREYQPFDL
jgi:hypothetical protein